MKEFTEIDLLELMRGIGKEDVSNYFECADKMLSALSIKMNDERVTYGTAKNNRLTITIGQRYCLAIRTTREKPFMFISQNKIPSLTSSPFDIEPEAYICSSKRSSDFIKFSDEIVEASQIELNRTKLSGFRKSNNELFEKAIFEKNYRDEIYRKAFQSEMSITGTLWKLGCNWASGLKSFYEFIKEEKIVIGVEDRKYSTGDLIMVTEGFDVKAIARVNEEPKPVLSNSLLKAPFDEYEIEYNERINYANAEWYELPRDIKLTYRLQKGIVIVNKNHEIYQKIIEIWNNRNSTKTKRDVTMKSKNIILYGPPGTGKTYNSIDKAVEIATGSSSKNHTENKKVFDELRKTGQIEFVTFHQNYSYEDFMVGIRPDLDESSILKFKRSEGIFYKISKRAEKNWLITNNKKEVNPDFGYIFNGFFSKLIEEEVKEVEIPMKSKGYKFKITSIDLDDGKIKFTKQSGGTGHDLLVKNVKNIYEGTLDYGTEGLGVYYNPLVEKLKEYAKSHIPEKSSDEELKNYVLIIDEINRANISKVLGELITLLEEDKRLDSDNELKITLPNGEKDFGVPPNLHIIGTMNTADKSIALIDIALRRRFEFIGYYPQYSGYESEACGLLKKINDGVFSRKKSADYLIGHAYFMKDKNIAMVLRNKVVPLLMEYFSGKSEVVSEIFIGTGWSVTYDNNIYEWNIAKK